MERLVRFIVVLVVCGSIRLEIAVACLPHIRFISGSRGAPPVDQKPDKTLRWTTAEWITQHQYPLETHVVTTADGFKLELHRIPRSEARSIILVHGFLTSSVGWVLLGPQRSLGFLLHDKGFDVWMANLRGSAYGQDHNEWNVSSKEFWDFSFHDQGSYDLPSIIDFVRNETKTEKVLLVVHSQAFCALLVLLSVHPTYNERIEMVQALAPILELRNFTSFSRNDVTLVSKYLKRKIADHSPELLPKGFLKTKCVTASAEARSLCWEVLRTLVGPGQHSRQLSGQLFGQLLQGGSVKEVLHLKQIWESGDFVSYDYGVEGNRLHYNSVDPFNYDLSLVQVPLVLHFGDTDAVATPAAVRRIYSRRLATVKGLYHVPASRFNHLDFLCSPNARTLIYDRLVDILKKLLAHQLPYVID